MIMETYATATTTTTSTANAPSTVEEIRLEQTKSKNKNWYKWGPYLSERSWATVREDYSFNGDAWRNFPFEHANSRVFRWGEDGLFGVSDNRQQLCTSIALWNGRDERLKERLFGLTGPQGNHGEDVKELYYYLDNLPSHAYMKALYKYPFARAFPYAELREENEKRGYQEQEFEIYDIDGLFKVEETGDTPYFDVFYEMAKDDNNPDELNFRVTVYNRSEVETGELYIIPQVFFRNTWSYERDNADHTKPVLKRAKRETNTLNVTHKRLGKSQFVFQPSPGVFNDTDDSTPDDVNPVLLFTENESDLVNLFGEESNKADYTKNAFEEYLVHGDTDAVNPELNGTKACAVYHFESVPPGEYVTVRYKFTNDPKRVTCLSEGLTLIDEDVFDQLFEKREDEADEFYQKVSQTPITKELRDIQRQAFAGMLWTKQFYNFIWDDWYNGDKNVLPRPPPDRANGRNKHWKHLHIEDILSLPDKWEYPFFASWDTAFHCIPLSMIDPEFAKNQLILLTKEWYMHPNGQIPAYEWNFDDVNPPVHAWATYRVFKIERNMYHREDRDFLESVFQKLLLNFTWWVNRKDADGKNVFEGGFLGLDNIGIFNRSEPLPTGGTLEQADSTGWMAFFCLQMLNIALELAKTNHVYESIASKFFEHFILISDSMSFEYSDNDNDENLEKVIKQNLWNDDDKFYYDAISWGGHDKQQLPIRSLVGLIPLYASLTLEPGIMNQFPEFKKRVEWFVEVRPDIFDRNIASMSKKGVGERLLLSLVTKERLEAILTRLLDEDEFLSDYGIRSLSKYHKDHPFKMNVKGTEYVVQYIPGESDSGMFGGNSNWRGPIWFPTSFLIIESLQRFFLYYGDSFKVECPVGSGQLLNLAEVAEEIACRMIQIFIKDENGRRAIYEGDKCDFLSNDPYFREYLHFYEFFDGDTGRGLGASHQCGWTALVAKWIHDVGISGVRLPRTPRSALSASSPSSASPHTEELGVAVDTGSLRSRRWFRRKSTRSLVSFTADVLEMTDEEKRTHRIGGTAASLATQTNVTKEIALNLLNNAIENVECEEDVESIEVEVGGTTVTEGRQAEDGYFCTTDSLMAHKLTTRVANLDLDEKRK